jgi:hypothetical protein
VRTPQRGGATIHKHKPQCSCWWAVCSSAVHSSPPLPLERPRLSTRIACSATATEKSNGDQFLMGSKAITCCGSCRNSSRASAGETRLIAKRP